MRITADNAELSIQTFKEGLLASVGHDLLFVVRRFSIDWDTNAGTLSGSCSVQDIELQCALQSGRPAPDLLSSSDRQSIVRNMRSDVLKAAKFPALYASAARMLEGDKLVPLELEIAGARRTIACTRTQNDNGWSLQANVHLPDFGIKPFSALMGTLRVHPTVKVRLDVPARPLGQ